MSKILFVDRDKRLREIAIDLFNSYDHEVITASCPPKALELFKKHQPQVVVTEFKLPKIDGLCLKKTIDEIREISKVFLVLDGGILLPQEEARRLGVDMVFGKPFMLSDILEHF